MKLLDEERAKLSKFNFRNTKNIWKIINKNKFTTQVQYSSKATFVAFSLPRPVTITEIGVSFCQEHIKL